MHAMLRRYGFLMGPIFFEGDDGGGGGSGGSGEGGSGGGEGGSGGEAPKTFTQEELNRIGAKEHSAGKSAAMREFAERFGMTVDEAEALVKAKRSEDDAKLTEIEKRERDAEEANRKAADREAAANRRARDADAMAALVSEGIVFERDDDGKLVGKGARVLALATAGLKDDASSAEIAQAVIALKTDTPELFGGAGGGGNEGGGGKPPSGDLGGGKPKDPPTEDDLERGRKRAEAHNASHKPFDPLAL